MKTKTKKTAKRVVNGLNAKEQTLLSKVFFHPGKSCPKTITEMAAICWPTQSKARANSWTRNSLRKPVRYGILQIVESGLYDVLDREKGKAALKGEPLEEVEVKAKATKPAKVAKKGKKAKKVATPTMEEDLKTLESNKVDAIVAALNAGTGVAVPAAIVPEVVTALKAEPVPAPVATPAPVVEADPTDAEIEAALNEKVAEPEPVKVAAPTSIATPSDNIL